MSSPLAVLVVIAHPDDETLYGGFLHALTHKLQATVDLVCVTNGEGGFRHSGASECLYNNLQLSTEQIGRQHLPRIRKEELLASGRILGIRKFFFYDQLDLKYDRNVEIVFAEQWKKEIVRQQLLHTVTTGNGTAGYDLMLIMLPSAESHGHHTASGIIALEVIADLQQTEPLASKIPTVIGGSEFVLDQLPTYSAHPLADISSTSPNQFVFHRTWKLADTSAVSDYQMIVLWMCSEHKSQGSLIAETLASSGREQEQYFYFAINDQLPDRARLQSIENLFTRLANVHQGQAGNR